MKLILAARYREFCVSSCYAVIFPAIPVMFKQVSLIPALYYTLGVFFSAQNCCVKCKGEVEDIEALECIQRRAKKL